MTDQPPRPRGRPPKGRRRVQISLYLYPEELDDIDAALGKDEDRNVWIRQAITAALLRRPTPAAPGRTEEG